MELKTLITGRNGIVVESIATSLRLQGRNSSIVKLNELDRLLSDLPSRQNDPELVVLVEEPDFDRTVSVLRRLRSRTSARLVTAGEMKDAHRILESVRAGSDDYLDLDDNLDDEVGRLLSRMTDSSTPKPGRVISFASANGGCGCSTLATNCAASLAREHERCALLDLQPWTGDLAALLDVRPKHNFADLAKNLSTIDSTMLEQSMYKHENGIHLLAAPSQYPDVIQLTPHEMTRILQTARTTFSHVILDVQDCFHDDQLTALELSDVVLLVLRLDFVSIRNTRRTLEHLEQHGVDTSKIELVANRCGQSRQLLQPKAEEALQRPILHTIPNDPKRVIHAMNCGVPVVLESSSSRVARSLKQLASSLTALDA